MKLELATRADDPASTDLHRTFKPTHSRTLGLLVRGKNINPETLLATDYLNHFNEIIMLLEMVPSLPECLEDARAWTPKSYQEHFRDSAFTDKELAILAYENAPPEFRKPFDATIAQMNNLVAVGLRQIEAAVASGQPAHVENAVHTACAALRRSVDLASGIIHGRQRGLDQSDVDEILNR